MLQEPNNSVEQDAHAVSAKALRIFVTVGTDLPFDRLVKAVDTWAKAAGNNNVMAQIGKTSYAPDFIAYENFLEPPEFRKRFLEADLIISHAGMGTILSSLQFQKPLLVMPRIAALGEHRNEHQLATAKHLNRLNKVNVAENEDELIETLNSHSKLETREPIGPHASASLTDAIKNFINL